MRTLQVINYRSVRSVICEGFMTNHTTVVLHRLNTTVSVNESQNNHSKWPEMALYLALLSSFDLTVAVLHLHYYGKQCLLKR